MKKILYGWEIENDSKYRLIDYGFGSGLDIERRNEYYGIEKEVTDEWNLHEDMSSDSLFCYLIRMFVEEKNETTKI